MIPLLLVLSMAAQAQPVARNTQAVFTAAVADFRDGRFKESVETFDVLAGMLADDAHLWQRGIALYYARQYKACRVQFEAHRRVNPNDVENAAWHFLCVARGESPTAATQALLPVGPDPRVPMSEIYGMFKGTHDPADVLKAAGKDPQAEFYARLYLGLYYEAFGMRERALENIKIAAEDRFAKIGGYMHMVAQVHLKVLSK